MERYKKGEVYVCASPECDIEVTVTKPCTDHCADCGPLICCDKPMVKKK